MAELLKRSQFGPALALEDHADPMIDDADAKLLKPSMVPTRRLMIGQKFAQMTFKARPNDPRNTDDVDGKKVPHDQDIQYGNFHRTFPALKLPTV